MGREKLMNKMSVYIGCVTFACLAGMGLLPHGDARQIATTFEANCVPLNDLSNMTNVLRITTNNMNVAVLLVQDGLKYSYLYALLDCDFPKEIHVQSADGKESRSYYQGKGNLIRHIELQNNVLNGQYVDFYTNGNVQTYMSISNGIVVSRIFYDATGKIIFQSESPVDFGKMPIIK